MFSRFKTRGADTAALVEREANVARYRGGNTVAASVCIDYVLREPI